MQTPLACENWRKWQEINIFFFFSGALRNDDVLFFSVLKAKKDGLRTRNTILMWEGVSQLKCFVTFEMPFNVYFRSESMTLVEWVCIFKMMVHLYLI